MEYVQYTESLELALPMLFSKSVQTIQLLHLTLDDMQEPVFVSLILNGVSNATN